METPLELVVGQFELQTRLYANVLVDMSDESHKRLNGSVNHLAWLAGHLVSTRYMLVNLMGQQLPEPHPEHFENGKAIDTKAAYPAVAESLRSWQEVSPKLLDALRNLTAGQLSAKAPFALPTGDRMDQLVGFFAHHEAYHIGQMGILRKYFGREAMKYS